MVKVERGRTSCQDSQHLCSTDLKFFVEVLSFRLLGLVVHVQALQFSRFGFRLFFEGTKLLLILFRLVLKSFYSPLVLFLLTPAACALHVQLIADDFT